MPIVIYQGERSVAEIADRLYARLTPNQRETATAALIRANPALERIAEVPRGAVIQVPDIPALRAKATTGSPAREALRELDAALKPLLERLAERQARDEAEVKTGLSTLRSAAFGRAVERSPEVKALAETARAALEARAGAGGDRRRAVETAIGRASADLADLMARL